MPKAPRAPAGKQNKVIHPNSRQAMCIQRQANRDSRVMKVKAESSMKQIQMQQKMLWYQKNLDPQKTMYTKHELAELTCKYLDRFKGELEQISIVNSVGNRQFKQHQPREAAIKITEEKEGHEFDTVGVEVPDLVNGRNLEYFKQWTGEIRYFPNIKMRRSKRTDIKQDEPTEHTKDIAADSSDDVKQDSSELPDYNEPLSS